MVTAIIKLKNKLKLLDNDLADSKPVLKDLLPLDKNPDDENWNIKKKKKIDSVDRKNWMNSIQLGNDHHPEKNTAIKNVIHDHEENTEAETKVRNKRCHLL